MRLTATLTSHSDGFGHSVRSVFSEVPAALFRVVERIARFYRNRAALTALGALSDHELRDIGLTRGDLITASAAPSGSDPTSILADLAAEKRRWRRGS
jgi:uncharacterized protein YjiS (DUF1127 family)